MKRKCGKAIVHILVATKETQGDRTNDFFWCEEGEPVVYGVIECSGEAVDGPCGCRRSLSGVRTRRSTTTFKVVEADEVAFRKEAYEGYVAGRWAKDAEGAARMFKPDVDLILRVASDFNVGDILERRGDSFRTRQGEV